MDIIWGVVVGLAVTWLVLKIIAGYLHARNEILRKDLEEINKRFKEKFISCNIEKHGEVFYLFEEGTDRFIAQGKDLNELKLHCDSRFKTQVIITDNEQMEKFGLK